MALHRVPLIAAIAGLLSACGASPASTARGGAEPAAEARDVREVHRARCGNCHVRVEPGTRTRAALEDAFVRHRKRVRMSDAEWSQMLDYLASDGSR